MNCCFSLKLFLLCFGKLIPPIPFYAFYAILFSLFSINCFLVQATMGDRTTPDKMLRLASSGAGVEIEDSEKSWTSKITPSSSSDGSKISDVSFSSHNIFKTS
jgi:hypothetical protein